MKAFLIVTILLSPIFIATSTSAAEMIHEGAVPRALHPPPKPAPSRGCIMQRERCHKPTPPPPPPRPHTSIP
ncbi:hypothetical protein SLE2022_189570 [Rubroshorea leprosula]